MIRIGVFCGTFSPPHNGHLSAARAFMEQMWLDYLYVIPTGEAHDGDEVGVSHRLAMCRLAFGEMRGVCVSDMGAASGEDATVEVLRALSGEDRRLFLLCGTDAMLSLGERRDAEEIFRLSYPAYVRRERDPMLDARIVSKISQYQEKFGRVMRRIVAEPTVLSSQTVRERIGGGSTVGDLIPASVEKYIIDNHLYV